MTDQPSKRPPAPDWARAGATFAPIGAVTVIVGIAPLPTWAVVGALAWLLLCLIAWLGTLDAASRVHIARSLREARFTQLYNFTAGRQLTLLWRRFCDAAPADAGLIPSFRAALTWRLYDGALFLAVAYPILLLVGWWLLGFEGRVGSAMVLPAAPWWPDRAAAAAAIAFAVLVAIGARWGRSWRPKGVDPRFLEGMPIIAIGVFALGMGGFGLALFFGLLEPWVMQAGVLVLFVGYMPGLGIAGAHAVGVMGLVATGVPAGHAVAGAAGGAIASGGAALTLLVTMFVLEIRNRHRLARAMVTATLPIAWIAAAIAVDWPAMSHGLRGLFLFLAVLPLLNALVDVISYAVTLTLMRRGLWAAQPLAYGLLDFAAALALFLALGAALTAVIAGLNRIAGAPILDLGALFAGLEDAPHDYWWLYAMVFSTLVPTALHGALSLLGAQALAPLWLRRPAADLLAGADGAAWKAVAAPLAIGAVWALPVFAAAGILGGLWWLGADALAAVGGFYLQILTDLAFWIGAF